MQMERNIVLLGGVDSGKNSLADLIFGQNHVSIDCHGREVRASNSCLRIFETTSGNREFCLHVLRSQTVNTCFVVVVDVTKSAEFVNELNSLKLLSDHLAHRSYSLFGNCLVAFTNVDKLSDGVDKQQLVDREFGEILSLVDRRFMLVNSTLVTQENRDRVLGELVQLSKPVLRILCYGNNDFTSAELTFNLSEENTGNIPYEISIHHAPDLDLFHAFIEPVYTPELVRLIGQPDRIGRGVSVFLILISLNSIFSQSMLDLITSIPDLLGLEDECSEYFWSKAVIAFDANGPPDPEEMIRLSIEGNVGIEKIYQKVSGRYIYLSQVKSDALVNDLVIQSKTVQETNRYREFIGGGDINGRVLRAQKISLLAIWNSCLFKIMKVVCVTTLSALLWFMCVYVFPKSMKSIILKLLKIFKRKMLPSFFKCSSHKEFVGPL